MPEKALKMKLLKGKYMVCRLDKDDIIPEWVKNSEFYSITRTSDELSIVCSEENIPDSILNNYIRCEKDWRILKIEGPLDFSLIGILASISTILAQKGISIFAVSTYETDYILVKNKDIDSAIAALVSEGYEIMN